MGIFRSKYSDFPKVYIINSKQDEHNLKRLIDCTFDTKHRIKVELANVETDSFERVVMDVSYEGKYLYAITRSTYYCTWERGVQLGDTYEIIRGNISTTYKAKELFLYIQNKIDNEQDTIDNVIIGLQAR